MCVSGLNSPPPTDMCIITVPACTSPTRPAGPAPRPPSPPRRPPLRGEPSSWAWSSTNDWRNSWRTTWQTYSRCCSSALSLTSNHYTHFLLQILSKGKFCKLFVLEFISFIMNCPSFIIYLYNYRFCENVCCDWEFAEVLLFNGPLDERLLSEGLLEPL